MAYTLEQHQRALQKAQAAGDTDAVAEIQERINGFQSTQAKPAEKKGLFDRMFPRGTPSWMVSKPNSGWDDANAASGMEDTTNPFAHLDQSKKTAQGALGKAIGSGVKTALQKGAGIAQGATIDPAIALAQMAGADEFANSANTEYEKFRKNMGGEGFDVSRLVGNVVSPVGVKGAQAIDKGFKLWGKAPSLFRQGATQGAFAGAIQPIIPSEQPEIDPETGLPEEQGFWGEKAKQVGTGALFGGALNKLIGRANPQAYTNPNNLPATAQQLANQKPTKTLSDIEQYRQMFPEANLTWGQNFPWLNKFEQKLTSAPFVGESISRARDVALKNQNVSMMNKALEPAGVKLDKGTSAGREMFEEAYQKLGSKYDKILDETTLTNPVKLREQIYGKIDDAGEHTLGAISDDYAKLSEAGKKRFDDLIEKGLFQKFGKDPQGNHSVRMTGRKFKEHEESLKNTIDDYMHGVGEDRTIGRMLKNSLDEAYQNLQGVNPEVSKELKNINKAYAQYKTLESASTASAGSGGVFNPLQTIKAATKGSRQRVAHGKGLLQDEAELSQRVLGKPVPDSGTASRLFAGNPLVGLAGGLTDLVAYPFLSPAFATTVATGGRNLGRGIENTRLGGALANKAHILTPALSRYKASNVGSSSDDDEEEKASGGMIKKPRNKGRQVNTKEQPIPNLRTKPYRKRHFV